MLEQFKNKYPELKNLKIHGFSGGGAALQRGGGRVTEVAHNHGRVARYFHAKTMGPSLLTIQGHQMQILFSPSSIALNTLESLVAQNLHARAQTELKPNGEHYVLPHNDKAQNSGNYNFNQLFANAPWVSVILGNLSSRPSKRGGISSINENITVIIYSIIILSYLFKIYLRGDTPKLLNNRAITVERVSAHSGTHFLNYLSVSEGLKSLNYDELHDMYHCSKSCRDFMRNTALSLHMTDFDIAWLTMI
ncbi:unnamed protein product, partial [Rotaria socialis]